MSREVVSSDDAPPLVDVDAVAQAVADRVGGRLTRRSRDLAGAIARWFDRYHNGIADEEVQGKTTDLVRQIASFEKRVDEDRLAMRQSLKEALDIVDGRYRSLTQGFDDKLKTLREHLQRFAAEKADREKSRRAEMARKATARAEQAAEAAASSGADDDIFTALQADMRADAARARAGASLAEMSRTRSDLGGQVGLRAVWKWRVVDPTAVPREFLTIDSGKIEEAKRTGMVDGKCTASIAGIEFYEDTTVQIR